MAYASPHKKIRGPGSSSPIVYDPEKPSPFDSLSDEIVLHILKFMPIANLIRFSEVDRRMCKIVCETEVIWRRLIPHLIGRCSPMNAFIAAEPVLQLSPFLRKMALNSTRINISNVCWIHEQVSDPRLIETVTANGLFYAFNNSSVKVIISRKQISDMQQANVHLAYVITECGITALIEGFLTVEQIIEMQQAGVPLSAVISENGILVFQNRCLTVAQIIEMHQAGVSPFRVITEFGTSALIAGRLTVLQLIGMHRAGICLSRILNEQVIIALRARGLPRSERQTCSIL